MKRLKNKYDVVLLTFLLLVSLIVGGCTFEENTYKTMKSLNETYNATMESVNDLRKKGLMTPEQVDKALELGNHYYESFQLASDVFKVYLVSERAEDKEKLTVLLGELPALLYRLQEYVNHFE